MVKSFSEHRVVKPQRGKLYCKLIPEPVCGLGCAKASLSHANLSLISLNYSRQVCSLHITNKPKTHSHTLKPFSKTLKSLQKKKEYPSTYFSFISKRFEQWKVADIPTWVFYISVYFEGEPNLNAYFFVAHITSPLLNCHCTTQMVCHWCDSSNGNHMF